MAKKKEPKRLSDNELERKYGIFIVPGKKRPDRCDPRGCLCEKFRTQDEEGLCAGKCFEKRLRSAEMQDKMLIADEKRDEEIRKKEEREAKYYARKENKDVSLEEADAM